MHLGWVSEQIEVISASKLQPLCLPRSKHHERRELNDFVLDVSDCVDLTLLSSREKHSPEVRRFRV